MNFFMNANMQKQKSGIEHAQLKRAKLFRDHQTPFKIVVRDWDPMLHTNTTATGLLDSEVLSMFDYYQETETFTQKVLVAQELKFGVPVIKLDHEPDANRYVAYGPKEDQILARINYFPDDENKQVLSTELFDGFGNLYAVEQYDRRGFVSLTQWYTPDNRIGTETWSTPDGRVVLETFNKSSAAGTFQKSGWRLNAKDGAVYLFDTIEELTAHFINEINADYWRADEPNLFVLDRTHLADWSVLKLDRPAYTVMHLHNSHAADSQETMHSVMNNNYEFPLTNINQYDAVISATQKQNDDVQSRFQPQTKLFTIPVGVVPDAHFDEPRIPMKDRTFGKVVALARIAPEKRLADLTKAVGIAKKKVPEITLDLYGYKDGTDNFVAMRNVTEAIEEYDLADAVTVHDYTTDVAAVEKDAQIFGLTSIMEGFNLSIMEAISQGDVGVTYDVNYGPNEIIVDGENGYVVPYNDYEAVADKLVELFSDPDKMQEMSDQSYELAKRYSETNVWHAWQELLADAQDSWADKVKHYKAPITAGLSEEG
ncbi:MAG: glycosyltransferase [Lactobacillaceae bacterium]|jgi:poly(glycerol-phosphate) alpha-glucosyltransferase|nr:glycosyltransferase [Lactobacillaceae bacterium]